jgi:plasmid maintenance system killer protein
MKEGLKARLKMEYRDVATFQVRYFSTELLKQTARDLEILSRFPDLCPLGVARKNHFERNPNKRKSSSDVDGELRLVFKHSNP